MRTKNELVSLANITQCSKQAVTELWMKVKLRFIEYHDTNAPPSQAFYRTVQP